MYIFFLIHYQLITPDVVKIFLSGPKTPDTGLKQLTLMLTSLKTVISGLKGIVQET